MAVTVMEATLNRNPFATDADIGVATTLDLERDVVQRFVERRAEQKEIPEVKRRSYARVSEELVALARERVAQATAVPESRQSASRQLSLTLKAAAEPEPAPALMEPMSELDEEPAPHQMVTMAQAVLIVALGALAGLGVGLATVMVTAW